MENHVDGHLGVNLKKDQVLCVEGETDHDLYIVNSGKLMICTQKGSQVIPVAYLGEGEYLGEMSFFDRQPRSATVIAVEETSLVKVPVGNIPEIFPNWLLTVVMGMIKDIRISDHLLKTKGIRKGNHSNVPPLSMEEQTKYFKLIKQYLDSKS